MNSKTTATVGAFAVILAVVASGTRSEAVTMADLLAPQATLVSGNLVFFNFTNVIQTGDLNVPLNQILVTATTGGPGASQSDYGIRFSSDAWTLTGSRLFYDISFDFHVTTLSGAPPITGNTLEFDGTFTRNGTTMIAESVIDFDSQKSLVDKMVFIDKFGQQLEDYKIFPGGPYSHIEISKDFAMFTGEGADSSVRVNHFDQSFSQVPEGGPTLAVTFAAFAGICLVGRGRFQNSPKGEGQVSAS